MSSEIILHIGLHKTGTSALQKFFSDHRHDLSECGVYYPDPAPFDAHHGLAVKFREVARGVPGAREKLLDDLAAIQESAGEKRVLISSEMFCEHSAFSALDVLVGFFSRITIVVYLRRQDLLLESAYNQVVKQNGDHRRIEDGPFYFTDYSKFLSDLIAVFGGDSNIVKLTPRLYERSTLVKNSIVDDFFEAASVSYPLPIEEQPITNESLSIAALEVVRKLNEFGFASEPKLLPFIADAAEQLFKTLPRRMAGNYFSHSQRESLLLSVRDTNEQVRAKYFPQKPPGSLFEEPGYGPDVSIRPDVSTETALELLVAASRKALNS